MSQSLSCRHSDIRNFDGIRTCLSCGNTIFESPSIETSGSLIADSNSETAETYRYVKLNYELGQEIRLLVIEPGSAKDDIRCNLITVNLLDKPEYEALSYTWATEDGDDSLSQVVYCDTHLTTLRVTKNCEAALLRLRRLGLRRTVWIDALCIDQNNTAERNHQVALMEKIYRGASKVLVYIDCAEWDFKILFQWLRLSDIAWNSSTRLLYSENNSKKIETLQIQVDNLLSLRWFHRVWVVQEVALSRAARIMTRHDEAVLDGETVERLKRIYYSDRTIYKDGVTAFPIGMDRTNLAFPGPLLWMPGWRELQRPDLMECLLATKNCSATDPRDRIFGILNLVDDEARSLVQVDYALDIITVYTCATANAIIQRGGLNAILPYVCSRRDVTSMDPGTISDNISEKTPDFNHGWPSWVPDWDNHGPSAIPQFANVPRNSIADRSNSIEFVETPVPLPISKDLYRFAREFGRFPPILKYCLRLKARFLDSIHTRGWISWIDAQSYITNSARYWESEARSQNESHFLGWRLPWLKGVNSGRDLEKLSVLFDGVHFAEHMKTMRTMNSKGLQNPAREDQDYLGRTRHYTRFLHAAREMGDTGYNMFRTEHSLGFARYDQDKWREGDVVVALDGARTPVILRSLGGDRYRITCDCYLMGALEYDSWKQAGGRGPWGELPDPVPEEQHTRMIDLY